MSLNLQVDEWPLCRKYVSGTLASWCIGLLSFDSDYFAIGVIFQFADFQTAEPCLSIGRHTVVVEQIPFSFILYNGMVRGPTHYRSEDDTLIGERSVRIVADGVTQAVRIAGGVGEIIFAVVFVHPTGFEETAFIVASRQRFAILIE